MYAISIMLLISGHSSYRGNTFIRFIAQIVGNLRAPKANLSLEEKSVMQYFEDISLLHWIWKIRHHLPNKLCAKLVSVSSCEEISHT